MNTRSATNGRRRRRRRRRNCFSGTYPALSTLLSFAQVTQLRLCCCVAGATASVALTTSVLHCCRVESFAEKRTAFGSSCEQCQKARRSTRNRSTCLSVLDRDWLGSLSACELCERDCLCTELPAVLRTPRKQRYCGVRRNFVSLW